MDEEYNIKTENTQKLINAIPNVSWKILRKGAKRRKRYRFDL